MGTAERRFSRLRGLFFKGYLSRFRFRTAGFIEYFGSVGKRKPPSTTRFSNKTAGCRRVKSGVWFPDFGFTPHFRKRLPEVCGKFRNPRAHCLFHVKKQQVEALPLSSAVVMSGICRILPDLAQARLGCLSIEAAESSLYLVICI